MAFPRRLLIDGEELVLDLRPHPIALAGPIAVIALVIVAWVLALPRLPDGDVGTWLRWIAVVVGAAIIVWYSVPGIVSWATSHFVVTSDRIIHRRGLIAKESMEIPLEAINDVRFRQRVFERLIGAGDLIISSASDMGVQRFTDIRAPEDVQKTIYHQGELNQHRMFGRAPQAGASTSSASFDASLGTGSPSVTTELHRLADLRDRGILTHEEFQQQKARILASPPSRPPSGEAGAQPE